MAPSTATLLVSPGCPHCSSMKQVLAELEQTGELGRLDIIDVSRNPMAAERHGVRSVPWLQIGELVFEGAHSAGELRRWVSVASKPGALTEYFRYLLSTGNLLLTERMLDEKPDRVSALVPLIEEPRTEMSVRVGIAAAIEGMRGTDALLEIVEDLVRLCHHEDAIVRADACHLLIQTESPDTLAILSDLVHDESEQVREIVEDGIKELVHKRNHGRG